MRKKIIFSLITAVSILLTVMSCDANLDLPAYSPDKILVMNGMVSTADTVHTIRLVGSSSSEGLFGIPDATVSIFVNDLLVGDGGLAETLVEGDFLQTRALHDSLVLIFVHQCRLDFLVIFSF